MFRSKDNHTCTLDLESTSLLPTLAKRASCFRKCVRWLRKTFLITEVNPRSLIHFRSTAEILEERKKQVESGTWIIHPFSIFRLYYEMWMAIIYFLCLIYMPVNAAYFPVLEPSLIVQPALCLFCFIDIIITFRTGYNCIEKEQPVMKPGAIAKRYILGVYLICDIVSSIPEYFYLLGLHPIVKLFALLKIVRFRTFVKYIDRTIYYFKWRGFLYELIKLMIVIFLMTHYASCIIYIMQRIGHDTFYIFNTNTPEETHWPIFWSIYFKNVFKGTAFLLGINYKINRDMAWFLYVATIIAYCIGKILATFGTVAIIDLIRGTNSLENKYYAMIGEVKAYMSAKKFPNVIQKKVCEHYYYKYRQKYFKETSITRFLSENLKREINYHACRKLVRGVKLFENLPQLLVEDILIYLKPEIYLTGDIIIRAGAEADCMYFLSSGTVTVSTPSGKEVCHLEDGAYFGEIALMTQGQKRTANVIALEICEVFKLDERSFKKCMVTNKDLYKILQQEAKRRLNTTKEYESMFEKEFARMFSDVKVSQ